MRQVAAAPAAHCVHKRCGGWGQFSYFHSVCANADVGSDDGSDDMPPLLDNSDYHIGYTDSEDDEDMPPDPGAPASLPLAASGC